MNFNILKQFRQQVYECFVSSQDALFNLAEALLNETQAHSLVELSLSPYFTRKWPSLYEGLQKGRVDQNQFEQTLVKYAPPPPARPTAGSGGGCLQHRAALQRGVVRTSDTVAKLAG